MQIVVLGSAAGGGLPQWNCDCANCRLARASDDAVAARTQSSVAVSAGRWLLLNTSPDIRQQIEHTPYLQPRGEALRASPIAGVVLTNADVDHVAGPLSLRERQRMTIYASQRVLDALAANPIFDVLDRTVVKRQALQLGEEVALERGEDGSVGLVVTAFPVPPLWLENTANERSRDADGDTVGLEVKSRASDARFFYIPGCAAMTPELAERLRGAPLVFFDGTTWNEEMQTTGVGEKTARRMGHISMAGPDSSIAAFASLGVRRKIFVHINNTNPVLRVGSPERRQAEAQGWELAEDGLEVAL